MGAFDPYRAILRPLLFALPPEASHRVAGALLALPLPWPAIGGVRDHPSLHVRLCGIPLVNPVGLAAGFDKGFAHAAALGRLGFGYVVGGTVTRRLRAGNPKPRIARSPRSESMVNAMGLPNPGVAEVARRLARLPRTCPRIASLADEEIEDAIPVHRLLEPLADAIELNASCPNVTWGRDRGTEEHLARLLGELAARKSKPLFVKLPPFHTDAEREAVLALATIAQERGADALTCSNTRPVADARLTVGRGGLSGRALYPDTVEVVRRIRDATEGELPVNACGGISTPEEALECLEAGATTIQIYTGLVYRGPRILRELTEGLAEALDRRGTTLAALVGSA